MKSLKFSLDGVSRLAIDQERREGCMRVLREDSSAYELRDDDIIYFTTHNNVITVHTLSERFIVPTSLDQLTKAYQSLSFTKVDRSYSVRLDRIAGYHRERRSIYFEGDSNKLLPVSEPNVRKVTDFLHHKRMKQAKD
ncbi:LytTR family DNA-binding domain-containing protein [Paenibacillus cremeus]|uniref:LytTR family transcriptional regulator n=1 Tax=Paenibacillus cremeus TaxID=2163881 RepID=A0A559JVK8_9BACL|nr:LytTR family DNA-binding domain-containing protein [Paenibacillus cremeus]TVY03934.1 LytTR family transcriptional regulator [Paenibacillus cremeus]